MSSGVEIKLSSDPPADMQQVLTQIFWKDADLAAQALEFMDHIKEWGRTESPYTVSEWNRYCGEKRITQSSYHNMLRRLKNAGIIEKRYNKEREDHELYLSGTFSNALLSMAKVFEDYRSRL
jgi:hypothetical protein